LLHQAFHGPYYRGLQRFSLDQLAGIPLHHPAHGETDAETEIGKRCYGPSGIDREPANPIRQAENMPFRLVTVVALLPFMITQAQEPSTAVPNPPVAPTHDHTEVRHGTAVSDPYFWLR